MGKKIWKIFLILLILFLTNGLSTNDEKKTTSTRSEEVCDVDSTCNTTTITPIEIQTDKMNVSEKWKYNISDGILPYNESKINIFNTNDTNTTINFEIDDTTKAINQTMKSNETKFMNTKYRINLKKDCFCDITKGSCNINCCCDRDCSYVNRDVFKVCNETENTKDEFCESKILNSPFLCVVKDNLYSTHFYPPHQVTPETTNIEKLLKNRLIYGWSFPSLPPEQNINEEIPREFEKYNVGSHVWLFTNDFRIKKFHLPKSTIISRNCDNTEPVSFLNDYNEICTYRIHNITEATCENQGSLLNAAKYFANFSFITNPNLINSSFNCFHNCVNVTPFICHGNNLDFCKPANTSLKSSFSNNTCYKAVTNVHYNLIHNGTEGILSAQVYLELGNIKLKPNLLWSLSFKLTYQWVNQTKYFELSGYPGYIFGKPIITGYKTVKSLRENKSSDVMEMNYNHKYWLSVFGTDVDGRCSKMRRYNVLFRENIYAHCFIEVPKINTVEYCEIFQNEIFNNLFGMHTNLTNFYVSSLGDPDINDESKWIPLTLNFSTSIVNETCSGIVTSIKIIILHASIGEHDNPQQTIVGVKVNGNLFDKNLVIYEKVKISFSVNFYDITNPPLRIFAEPPTYEVKLPTDFFYPFFSNGLNLQVPTCFLIFVSIFLIIRMYCNLHYLQF